MGKRAAAMAARFFRCGEDRGKEEEEMDGEVSGGRRGGLEELAAGPVGPQSAYRRHGAPM
jgi:hypothetical protein